MRSDLPGGLGYLPSLLCRPASRFVQVAGVDVHLLDEGPRDCDLTVVLLSAQWLGVSHGDDWAPLLTSRYRVLRIDLPGQGLTGRFADGDYSAGAYARLLAGVLHAMKVGQHVIVGTSFSGITAALYAADQPAGLRGLVLATASGLPRGAGAAPGVPPADLTLASVAGVLPRAFYAWKLDTLLCRPTTPEARARIVDEAHVLNEMPGRAAEAARRVAQFDSAELTAALPQVAVPVLVQWSSSSTYLPPEMADRIAALVARPAGVHHYPETGHLLIADAPRDTARDVARFLVSLT